MRVSKASTAGFLTPVKLLDPSVAAALLEMGLGPGRPLMLLSGNSIEQAVLLLVGHWYANRETVAVGVSAIELPMATNALWKPHRWVNV